MPKSKERCQKIREEMRNTILQKSMLYFAKNGFAGTKISDLSRSIGIGQGTIYVYFESKEELYKEILKIADYRQELKQMKLLLHLPISAEKKLRRLSERVLSQLREDEMFAAKIALNTQILLEQSKLADYYWGVVYLYALKRLFTTDYEMISVEDLERTVLR